LSAAVTVVEDPGAPAAELLAEAAGKGGHVVLTGGSTPRAAYERAATQLDDWSAVELWFTDERCVPPEHEHSNYGMVKAALLDGIEGRGPGVHRMQGELGPGEGAAAYASEIEAAGFGEARPAFDLMLLGLGPDAHVCSLFPGQDSLGERERNVIGVETPGMAPLVSRITLTLPVVNAARRIVVLVTGEDKAEAVRRAFGGAPDPAAPGSLVQPESGSLELLVDPAAASQLEGAA
jgi:6-phosphogluconolactonase